MKRLLRVKLHSSNRSRLIARCGNGGIRSVDFHISTRRVLADRHIVMSARQAGCLSLLFAFQFRDVHRGAVCDAGAGVAPSL